MNLFNIQPAMAIACFDPGSEQARELREASRTGDAFDSEVLPYIRSIIKKAAKNPDVLHGSGSLAEW